MSTEPTTTSEPRLPCDDIASTERISSTDVDLEDTWYYPYGPGEVVWGVLLVVGIFGVNLWVLWVVGHSRELWKPRHLWMACLCVTDLFVGVHKVIELLLLVLPRHMQQLCIINKATFGIPYILNILLLTLLSLDRFIAVSYPFIYSSVASNKHVGIGFLLVLGTGVVLSWSSIATALEDVVCRVHFLQLKYLIITLTICSVLTLFFNISVLRIAKKQLTAIYSSRGVEAKPRPLSVICSNCGHTTETTMGTFPVICLPMDSTEHVMAKVTSDSPLPLPLLKSEVSPFLDSSLHPIFENLEPHNYGESSAEEMSTQIIRTASLPEILPTTPILMGKEKSIREIMEAELSCPEEMTTGSLGDANSTQPLHSQLSRRTRSLFSCNNLVFGGRNVSHPHHPLLVGTRIQFFRNLHFNRAHVFHVGRLFPSIRFARTVLLIMIPMWIFILPVITIIPLHRSCEVGTSEFGCSIVETLWTYLLVHIRSVLLLQAILDTLIYACRSKEFRNVLKKGKYNRKKYIKKKHFPL